MFLIRSVAGPHLLESPLSSDQQATASDDGDQITATLVLSEQLRGFNDDVTVLQPPGCLD